MSDAPVVHLAGRDWPVPVLSVKRNRIVIPAFLKFMPTFVRIAGAVAGKDKDPVWFLKIELTTEDFDLVCDVVYNALLMGTPGLARAEFDNMTIQLEELFTALPVIAKQTGILKPAAPGQAPVGENQATVESTLISSSPTTALAPASDGQTS